MLAEDQPLRRRLLLLAPLLLALVGAGLWLWRGAEGEPRVQLASDDDDRGSRPAGRGESADEAPAPDGEVTLWVEVLSTTGTPIPGAKVRVVGAGGVHRGDSGPEGLVSLEGLPHDELHVRAEARGYAPAEELTRVPDELTELSVTLTLAPAPEAAGRTAGVVLAHGEPVKGALVIPVPVGGTDELAPEHALRTGADGRFVLPEGAPAVVAVRALHPAHGDAEAQVKGPGDVVIELPGAARISGRVLGPDGAGVEDWVIGIRKLERRELLASSLPRAALNPRSDEGKRWWPLLSAAPKEAKRARRPDGDAQAGAFVIDLAPSGRVSLQAGATGFAPAETELRLAPGEHARDVVLRLERPLGVTGHVTDADTGAPIAGARVRAVRMRGMREAGFGSAKTDAEGRFELRSAAGRRTTLRATAKGYVPQERGGVSGRGGEAVEVSFALKRAPKGKAGHGGLDYVGIGAQIKRHDDGAVVVGVIKGGAAAETLDEGDVILRVDGVWTEGMKLGEIVDAIVGEPESDVELLVRRKGQPDNERVTLPRRALKHDG
jgi:hypothetical protein